MAPHIGKIGRCRLGGTIRAESAASVVAFGASPIGSVVCLCIEMNVSSCVFTFRIAHHLMGEDGGL